MRFNAFLNRRVVFLDKKLLLEWKEKWEYGGRATYNIVWIYITYPEPKGLIWADTNGDIYKNNKLLTSVSGFYKSSHKQLLKFAYPHLTFLKGKELTGNLRDDVDIIVTKFEARNPRGRVDREENTIYVYPGTMLAPFDEKRYDFQAKKAIKNIYKYITNNKLDVKNP